MALRLHVIIASTRPGRVGPKVAAWFNEFAAEHSAFDVHLIDLVDFDLPVFDEPKHPRLQQYDKAHTRAWSASVAAADAFVFVTPEYNYFAPPALVNAVSFLAGEWAYKPAGLVSYGGISGGLRAAQAEKLLLTTVKIMPIPEGVPVFMVNQFVGADGVFRPNEAIVNSAKAMLGELEKWAAALKPLHSTAA